MQSVRVVIVNTSKFGQAIALYANPRGGDATATFTIDDTLVQAHRLTAYSRYKIWQEVSRPALTVRCASRRCPRAARPIRCG